MREREDRTLPFAFRSEEMSLPTIREACRAQQHDLRGRSDVLGYVARALPNKTDQSL